MCFSVFVCLLSHSYVHCTTKCTAPLSTLSLKGLDRKAFLKEWFACGHGIGNWGKDQLENLIRRVGGAAWLDEELRNTSIEWNQLRRKLDGFLTYQLTNLVMLTRRDEKCLIKCIKKKNANKCMSDMLASMWHTDTLSVSANNMFTLLLAFNFWTATIHNHRTLTKQLTQRSSRFICQNTSVQVSLHLSVIHFFIVCKYFWGWVMHIISMISIIYRAGKWIFFTLIIILWFNWWVLKWVEDEVKGQTWVLKLTCKTR